MMIPKMKFVVLVLLLLPLGQLSLDLDCLKEMSSADGICYLNDCCRSLHTDKCRAELIARDEPSMAVDFLPNSLVFDRQANFLCIVGLETTPGEHMKDFIGAEVHVRKEHLWSSVQETTKMTFILTQPLRGAVPHDVNPLENMTMCLRLGTELDSLSPHVFITVELIPLNPDINEYPLTYKPIPFICELDRVIIEQKGECRLHSLYREPHQCSIETTAKAVAPSRNLPGVTSEPKPLIITEETKMWFEDRVWILIVVIIILLVSTLTSLAFIIFICQRVQTNEGRLRELEYRANPIPSNRYEVVGQSLPRASAAIVFHNQPAAFLNPLPQINGRLEMNPTLNNRYSAASEQLYNSIHYAGTTETVRTNQIDPRSSSGFERSSEQVEPALPSPGALSTDTTSSADSQTSLNTRMS